MYVRYSSPKPPKGADAAMPLLRASDEINYMDSAQTLKRSH